MARGMRLEERVRAWVKGYENPPGNTEGIKEGERGYE
jgi:hypothetical protein